MPDFTAYLSDTEAISSENRAVLAWRRIQDRPTAVTFKRVGAAQTVRIEWDSGASEPRSAAGEAALRTGVLFGIRNHPTEDDTNVRGGDRFVLHSQEYEVVDVILPPGEKQAGFKRI